MSPERVKIDEVDETQTMKVSLCDLDCLFHAVYRAFGFVGFCESLTVKNIIDLADRDDIEPRIFQGIERGLAVGFEGVVVAVAGAHKRTFFLSDIGSCDDAPDLPFVAQCQLSGDFAAVVELFQTESFLIPANLQDGICGGVDDHVPCGDLLLRKLVKDFCAAGALVANDNTPGPRGQFVEEFLGKSRFSKSLERFRNVQSHHFPVTCHRVLSSARFMQPRIISCGIWGRCDAMQRM